MPMNPDADLVLKTCQHIIARPLTDESFDELDKWMMFGMMPSNPKWFDDDHNITLEAEVTYALNKLLRHLKGRVPS